MATTITQSVAISFDEYYKQVNERTKAVEFLLQQSQERAETEERYSRFQEKVCGQMVGQGGELDSLLYGIKVDLHQRSQYNKVLLCMGRNTNYQYYQKKKQFTNAYKTDIEIAQASLKQLILQYKPICQEVFKLDREVKGNMDKYEKAREKYTKVCVEFQEAAIALEAMHWNKECQGELRVKGNQKLNTLAQNRVDYENQVKVAISYYTNALNQFNLVTSSATKSLKQVFEQLFALSKDLVMKTLVYEVSRTRNLQYDTEAFFKEVEKYTEPFVVSQNPIPASQFTLQLSREVGYKIPVFPPTSFMRDTADKISSHRLKIIVKREPPEEIEQMVADKVLLQDLSSFAIQVVSRAFQRPEPNITIAPLELLEKHHSYNTESLKNLMGMVKLMVTESSGKVVEVLDVNALDQNHMGEYYSKRVFREVIVITLESFRLAGQFEFSGVAFEWLRLLVMDTLDQCSREQDLHIIFRVLLMINTLYRMDPNDPTKKLFLQDAMLEYPLWQKIDVWEALIFFSIDQKIDKDTQILNNEQRFKEKNIIFSNIQSISLNMMAFKMDKLKIKALIQKHGKVFFLYDLQIQELISFIDNDGRMDNKQVNSLSVLQSLYSNNEPTKQGQVTNNTPQPKKVYYIQYQQVIIFDRKNPLGGGGPQNKLEEEKKIDEKYKKIQQEFQRSQTLTNPQYISVQQQQQVQQPTIKNDEVVKELSSKDKFEQNKAKFEQFQVEDPLQDQKKKAGFLKKLF